ncbi:hypothetical protein M2459_001348 [Parabacteroides sp. PF5-5]|uniref:hypothetical protein n=1 Tax=unclassified Parabacteroides TaxID=2649774 RepID=UPI00247597E3|nr:MULTISPECIES: hypothetical protein [unclassified Parabacteroides]MDH6304613.1 hypothetical protein [Parabacteroides sp. PH5-39]MDH6315774.1 hypothetical protein [Parabacteroides sp. PF5-13]MDH6319433.1 hypothetical protein [Parabacteroides sp. PH5-13]MDH6323164.1 hypothetical protein [Parabacteroides sp. PH5-8]MDH6326966.1 hypothetical protein [Parabacteroides sp. PH5-41]
MKIKIGLKSIDISDSLIKGSKSKEAFVKENAEVIAKANGLDVGLLSGKLGEVYDLLAPPAETKEAPEQKKKEK